MYSRLTGNKGELNFTLSDQIPLLYNVIQPKQNQFPRLHPELRRLCTTWATQPFEVSARMYTNKTIHALGDSSTAIFLK